MRTLRQHAWLLSLIVGAAPLTAFAFEGLDLSPKKSSKSKKKSAKKDKKEKEDPASAEVPMPAGGLDLTKPADSAAKPVEAKTPEAKPKTAPTLSFDAVDVSGKGADRQRIDVAANQFKAEQYEEAALSAYGLLSDPKMAALQVESQYLLAKSLYRMGLYHSALNQFSKILERGPTTRFFKGSLEWLFFIARKTVNETVVLDEIAKYSNADFPERFRNEFRYLLARYHFVRAKALDEVEQKADADKSYEEVRRLGLMIPKGDPFYPRAKYLEGLSHFRDGKNEAALEAMKEVVRVTRLDAGPQSAEARLMKSLRELAFMQLARTHYGARQNRNAIYYFNKIERGGAQWLESLFESSWAHYRIGQYELALGNLITLSSPFFRDEYFPEALILKAVIYFENCRYRESLLIIDEFEQTYGPVHEELERMVAKNLDSSEYYTLLSQVQKKNREGGEQSATDIILERILNLALTDKDLKKTNDSVNELEAELDGLGKRGDNFKYSGLTKELIEALKVQREGLIKKAGVLAKGKLEFEKDQLKTLRGNGLRIKFETTTKEKEFLEAQLQAGGNTEIVKRYNHSVAVSDEQLYWPFTGEFWRDELGTYQYTLTKGCVERKGARSGGE